MLDKFLESIKDEYEVRFDYRNFMPDIAIQVSKGSMTNVRRVHHSALSDEEVIINEIKQMIEEI